MFNRFFPCKKICQHLQKPTRVTTSNLCQIVLQKKKSVYQRRTMFPDKSKFVRSLNSYKLLSPTIPINAVSPKI